MSHDCFDDFLASHHDHAREFIQSKADTFDLCTATIKPEQQQQEEEEEAEEEEEEEDAGEFYIWDDLEEARGYYKHYKEFLCPTCATHTANFKDFVTNHRHHARAFLRPKSSYPRPRRRSLSINTSRDVAPPQYYPTKGMKRQYGGALEQIRVSHHTSLRNCHNSIEVSVLDDDITSLREFIDQHRDRLMTEFNQRLLPNNDFKVQMAVSCEYQRVVGDEQESKQWFVSNSAVSYNNTSQFMVDGAARLDEKLATYSSHGSNWVMRKIVKVAFIFTRYEDLCHLAGHSYIPTPPSLANPKKGIVNPRNTQDSLCFLYAILAVVKYDHVKDHRDRVSNYVEYLNELVYDEESMPMKIANVPKFERQNPQYRINIIRYRDIDDDDDDDEEDDDDDDDDDDCEVFKNPHMNLVYRSRNNDSSTTMVNLLLLENERRFHYVGVTNLSALFNTQTLTTARIQSYWCESCLHGFSRQSTLDKHRVLCESSKVGATVFTMPPKEKLSLKFNDLHKTVSPAYVVYADFESLLVPTDDPSRPQIHMPAAAGYLFTSATSSDIKSPLPTKYQEFYGSSCIVDFLASLEQQVLLVRDWYHQHGNVDMTALTTDEIEEFDASQYCYLCNGEFDDDKVRDHDHFTGQYIGPACNECNLARRHSTFLPVVFHNLRGYDMHHVMKHAIDQFPSWSISCIPQSSEKFLALTVSFQEKAKLRFIDSLQFLNASLKRLVGNLESGDLLLTNNISQLPDYVCSSKGIYPYSFPKSFDDLEQAMDELPPIDAFYDVLSEQINVTKAEHERANQIWKDVGCKSLKDYMMTYLKLDVFLLADVFETFRYTVRREDDGLDPLHFFSIPGLSWSSALKSMSRPLELIDDATMYQFFERGIRGGMTFVNKHRVTTNDDDDVSLLYIDINNLYGDALSRKLPCSEFRWIVDDEELSDLLHVRLPTMNVETCDVGYVFEVDLHTPAHLHDKLDQLPPAPITQAPPGSKVSKLLLTHEDKHHYVIHFALLQFYMSLGVEVTAVHRAVSFQQDYVFKQFIHGNTEKRAIATSEVARSFYKLKNNSLYGKTVENIRKRVDMRFCNSPKKLVTYASKSTFKRTIEISDALILAELSKETMCLDKPIYIGQAVLDLSKLRMFHLHYDELANYRREFDCQLNIVACDTDSFFLECINVKLEEQLLPAMIRDGLLDTSNYAKDHPLYSTKYASQIGKFKDESGGATKFIDAVFLRPKLYSLLTHESSKNVVKAKGVNVKQAGLHHQEYVDVLMGCSSSNRYVKQARIGSSKHQLYTMSYTKLALSCTDDKRHWIDWNTSLAYGHHRLQQHIRGE